MLVLFKVSSSTWYRRFNVWLMCVSRIAEEANIRGVRPFLPVGGRDAPAHWPRVGISGARTESARNQRRGETVWRPAWYGRCLFSLIPKRKLGLWRESLLKPIPRAYLSLYVSPLFSQRAGQMHDLRRLLRGFGAPNDFIASTGLEDRCNYVFIGDFVDRGPLALEVMALLLAFKVLYPTRVVLLRGNHEVRSNFCEIRAFQMEQFFDRSRFIFSRFAAAINAAGGRHQYRLWICVGLQSPILQPSSVAWIEVRQRCGAIFGIIFSSYAELAQILFAISRLVFVFCQRAEIIFNEFQNLFDRLPIGALVNGRILCVHGGIGAVQSLDQVFCLDQLYLSCVVPCLNSFTVSSARVA